MYHHLMFAALRNGKPRISVRVIVLESCICDPVTVTHELFAMHSAGKPYQVGRRGIGQRHVCIGGIGATAQKSSTLPQ
jgi:hypothetical protein